MKKFVTICCTFLIASILSAVELPPPFMSYETTSTAGGNGTAYTWNVRGTGISGNIYAGQVMLSSLSSSASFRFDGASGTLRFKCTNYAGGTGCFDPSWSCGWFTDDELINNRSGVTGESSYITCYFPNAGTHKVKFSISMQKHSSKYYVQGPRLEISDIVWLPDYVNVDVDGDPLRIEGEWIRQNISSDVLYDCRYDYSNVLNRVGANGCTVLDSYIAGLTPTNSNSKLLANIHMVDDNPVITWAPNLANRVYTIYGKTNLTDKAWHSPTNESSRFFEVEVSMPR